MHHPTQVNYKQKDELKDHKEIFGERERNETPPKRKDGIDPPNAVTFFFFGFHTQKKKKKKKVTTP